jgi:hypothetical protein
LSLEKNLKQVLENIESSKNKSHWGQNVELIAATKTQEISTIKECYKLGIKTIGENRVQEAEKKFSYFPGFEKIKKRFIGHLQTNKVKKCLNIFDTVDSLDSLKLATKVNKASKNINKKTECLIEVNTSSEPQKQGFSPKISDELISCFKLTELKIVGLMTVGPNTNEEKALRSAFILLRQLKDRINNELGSTTLIELSMGMTNDYEVAVQEGSTMVRVGTGLFGVRNYQ